MENIEMDVMQKLQEKGYVPDKEAVKIVKQNFWNALIENGFWNILDQTIDESGLKKPEVTIQTVKVGKEYKIKPTNSVITTLHNQKVEIKEIKERAVLASVLSGLMKRVTILIDAELLEPIK